MILDILERVLDLFHFIFHVARVVHSVRICGHYHIYAKMVGGFIIFVVICHLRGLFQRLLSWVSNEFFRNYSRGPRAHRIGLCRFGIFLLNLLKIV